MIPTARRERGIHHSAFEYNRFSDLNDSYLRLREAGIEPDICIDHGMTLSYYYKDPDGEPRRAAGRQLRRLGRVQGMDAH